MEDNELITRIQNYYKYMCLYEESLEDYVEDFSDPETKIYFKSSKDAVNNLKTIFQKEIWFGTLLDIKPDPKQEE